MPSPIFNALGGGKLPGPMGNMQQFMSAYQQFRSTFQGDPQQTVQQMLKDGRITQEQVNYAQQIAQTLGIK